MEVLMWDWVLILALSGAAIAASAVAVLLVVLSRKYP